MPYAPVAFGSSASATSASAVGPSMVEGVSNASPSAILRIVPRRILPERVFGRRGTSTVRLKLVKVGCPLGHSSTPATSRGRNSSRRVKHSHYLNS